MNSFMISSFFLILYFHFAASCFPFPELSNRLEEREQEWREFKRNFAKVYSEKEESMRKELFFLRRSKVIEHNKRFTRGEVTFFKIINRFSDMTDDERMKYLGYKNANDMPKPIKRTKRGISKQEHFYFQGGPIFYQYSADNITVPSSIDYRTSGWTEPVRDQGQCGSCWAFASSSALSYYLYGQTKINYVLSPQNLVDCSGIYGNSGCDGGWPPCAFEYMMTQKQALESAYPYKAVTNQCNNSTLKSAQLFGASSFVILDQNINTFKQAVVYVGPTVIAIDASYLYDYGGGIWDGSEASENKTCNANNINHALIIVGYVSNGNQNYWIIKNSWDATWGEQGYFKMLMTTSNLCGIYSSGTTLIAI